MTAPTFTPGPWRRVGHRTIAAGTGLDAVTVCEVFSGGVGLDQADANEALIEAAPELHAAAAAVFAWIDCGFLTVGVLADDNPARVAACGRAIDTLAEALGKAAGAGLDAVTVCEVFSGGVGVDQADANEALIEAAPELYAVARAAEAMLIRQKWRPDPSSPEGALLLALRTVLAKVSEGGAS